MKRMLALCTIVTAAVLAPATAANAHHLCVTSHGQEIVCAPHPEEWFVIDEICVTSGGRPIVCVP